jgi:hypothetical protein
LGHGYCTYNFFDQCPHRMACARCDFYVPTGSTKAQLLEAKHNLQCMLATIPLTDEARTAVEDRNQALDQLSWEQLVMAARYWARRQRSVRSHVSASRAHRPLLPSRIRSSMEILST